MSDPRLVGCSNLGAPNCGVSGGPNRCRICYKLDWPKLDGVPCAECGLPTLSVTHRMSGGGVVCETCLVSDNA